MFRVGGFGWLGGLVAVLCSFPGSHLLSFLFKFIQGDLCLSAHMAPVPVPQKMLSPLSQKLSEQQKSCAILQSSSLLPSAPLLSVFHTFSSRLHAERDDHHLAGPRTSSTSSGSSHWDRALCQNPAGLSLRRRLEKGFATGQVTNKFQFPSIS